MKRTILLGLCAVLIVAGCARVRESRINPFNWFGGAQRETRFELPAEVQDDRLLAPEVLDLSVEPYTAGALVKVVARTPEQGWWEAELVARPIDENGVLVYDLRMFPPITQTPIGTPASREITVGTSISAVMLERVTRIVVQGETNALSSGR